MPEAMEITKSENNRLGDKRIQHNHESEPLTVAIGLNQLPIISGQTQGPACARHRQKPRPSAPRGAPLAAAPASAVFPARIQTSVLGRL